MIMLELKKITKIYHTGEFKQKALDGITMNFRTNEFVSILGPSGSGKTTLLNIIGGLDQYTSGDLIINEISFACIDDFLWKYVILQLNISIKVRAFRKMCCYICMILLHGCALSY